MHNLSDLSIRHPQVLFFSYVSIILPGPLDDGFYKIEFVPDPVLFADAVGAGVLVVAQNQNVQKPTTVRLRI